jgi:type I restriction enzyme S subunit
MKTKTDKTLIPRLRFPEFQNSGEWEVKMLGDILNSQSSTLSLNKLKIKDKGYAVYGAEGIIGFIDEFQHNEQYISIVKDGSGVGRLNLCQARSSILGTLSALKVRDNKYSLIYAYYLLNTLNFSTFVKGAGIPHIYYSDYKELRIGIPTLPEQQKIASCLSSLDEVIAGERQKLELLKAHKKGLLQNLFPQEGETVPKLRFPEFKDSGEWVEKKLGEIYEFKITNSFSRDMLNYEFGEIKNIHYGDIHTKFNTLFDIKKEIVPFINPDVCIDKIKEDSYCKEGDIIFADASEDLNDVGKSIEIFNLNGEKLVSGLHTLLARQKENFFIVGFAGFLFKSDWIRKQIQKEAQGAKVLGISTSRISNINIKFPKSKKEQQKIASCLSSLDDVIQAQQQKIELLEQHKKGLLQGLFPNVNDGDNG